MACAFEFKKNGYNPVIFEKHSQIGEIMNFSGILLRPFIRHFRDPFKYIKEEFDLTLQPISKINKLIMKFPNKEVNIKGNLGYIIERSQDIHSLENQIVHQTDIQVIFESEIKVEDIKKDFDYVVVACADYRHAEKFGIWTNTTNSYARAARIAGDFEPGVCKIWFNTEYATHSFCYLVPKSATVATLSQVLDGLPENQYDPYWYKFLNTEKLKYEILEKKDTIHYSGFVHPMRVDNIFFVGKAAGLTENLIGIGAYNAIFSGIWAARSIIGNLDYNKIMLPYGKDILKMHEFRKVVNTFNNKNFDMLGTFTGVALINQLMYNNNLFKMRHVAFLAKLYNYFNTKN